MLKMYLDANAHVPMNGFLQNQYIEFQKTLAAHGHPSSLSKTGREAARVLEESRGKIASLIGAESPNQIFFTNSCTQAAEWGMKIFREMHPSARISPTEHFALYDSYSKYYGAISEYLPVDHDGVIHGTSDPSICIHLQNEIGIIQPIERLTGPKFCDLSQSLGKTAVDVTHMGIDVGIFGSHKFGGPSGFGFLYLKDIGNWREFGTGSRYAMDIPGTPNVTGAYLSALALEDAVSSLNTRQEKSLTFQATIETRIKELGLEIVSEEANRSPMVSFLGGLEGKSGRILLELSEKEIYVGLGSACGSMHATTNPLMTRLKKDPQAHNYLRISQWGEYGKLYAHGFLSVLEKVL